MATALKRLEARPLPPHMHNGPVMEFLKSLAPYLPFAARLVLCNTWLFGPLLGRVLGALPNIRTLVRTTVAFTIFKCGCRRVCTFVCSSVLRPATLVVVHTLIVARGAQEWYKDERNAGHRICCCQSSHPSCGHCRGCDRARYSGACAGGQLRTRAHGRVAQAIADPRVRVEAVHPLAPAPVSDSSSRAFGILAAATVVCVCVLLCVSASVCASVFICL